MEIWKRERRRRKEIKETIDNGEEREGERETEQECSVRPVKIL